LFSEAADQHFSESRVIEDPLQAALILHSRYVMVKSFQIHALQR